MKNEFEHLMIDLETMGHKSNSVICSIAAVEFNLATGETGKTFYERVSIQSGIDIGLKVDGDTIEWWLQKSEDARNEIAKGGRRIEEVLLSFSYFVGLFQANEMRLWGNSVRFDLGILQDAFNACNLKIPWNTRKELDVRTLVFLNPKLKEICELHGTAHNALDDCYFQIKYCSEIFKSLRANA